MRELQAQAKRHQQREIDLLHRERVARATVETERQQLRARHREKEKELVRQTKTNRERLKTFFRQAEDKLKRAIKSEQGAVHELFGDLVSGERATLRRWRASWNHKPIPLQVRNEVGWGVGWGSAALLLFPQNSFLLLGRHHHHHS